MDRLTVGRARVWREDCVWHWRCVEICPRGDWANTRVAAQRGLDRHLSTHNRFGFGRRT